MMENNSDFKIAKALIELALIIRLAGYAAAGFAAYYFYQMIWG